MRLDMPKPVPTLCLIALLAGAPGWAANDAAPSTAQIEHEIEAPPPLPEPTVLTLPEGKPQLLEEGKVSAAAPRQYRIELPARQRIEVRVSSPGGQAWQVVYRGDATTSEMGCGEADGCIGWISSSVEGGAIRIGVRTKSVPEIPFRLLVKAQPEAD